MKPWTLLIFAISFNTFCQIAKTCEENYCKADFFNSISGLKVTNLDVVPSNHNGTVIICYYNGIIKNKLNYLNGIVNGEFFSYYENGNIQSYGNIFNLTGI